MSIEKIDATGRTKDGKKHTASLERAVKFVGWPTPCQQDGSHGGPSQGTDRLPAAAQMVGWPTPIEQDSKHSGNAKTDKGEKLSYVVKMAGWATPAARDYRSEQATDQFNQDRMDQTRGKPLSWQAAEMENCEGYLNPIFSGWLMGFPFFWFEEVF